MQGGYDTIMQQCTTFTTHVLARQYALAINTAQHVVALESVNLITSFLWNDAGST